MNKFPFKTTAILFVGLVAMAPMAFAEEATANETVTQAPALNPPPKPQASVQLKAAKKVVTADASQSAQDAKQRARQQKAKQRSNNRPNQQQLKDIPDPVDLNSD